MAKDRSAAVLRQIRAVFHEGTTAELTDGQLLERFLTRDGEAAELAFSSLVQRHGSMVLRVCHGILRNPHDAEDAFQATFLVLVRKARGLWVRDSLGSWLHDVAYRVACHARAASTRRRRHEQRAAERGARTVDPGAGDDLGPVIHEEIRRLSERTRAPIVLCDLSGLTHEQAARQLGLPVGTIKSRLARGRERLRSRLIRRGVAPALGLPDASFSAPRAVGALSAKLLDLTVGAAMHVAAGKTAAGTVAPAVSLLTEGMMRLMMLNPIKLAALGLTLAVVGAAVGFSNPRALSEAESSWSIAIPGEVNFPESPVSPPEMKKADNEPSPSFADVELIFEPLRRIMRRDEPLNYQIIIRNHGPKEAKEIAVRVQFPLNIRPVSVHFTPVERKEATYDSMKQSLDFPIIDRLLPKGEVVLDIKAKALRDGFFNCRAFLRYDDLPPDESLEDVASVRIIGSRPETKDR